MSSIHDTKIRCSRLEEDQKKNEEMRFKLSMQERKINELFDFMYDGKTRITDLEKSINTFQSVIK